MNKRQCKKRIKLENKKLLKEYPFLKPMDWYGNPIENYDYMQTQLDDMPEGWKKAFGKLICEDIKKVLIEENYLEKYKIDQIKEKFGSLRWYCNGGKRIHEITRKYEYISKFVCVDCGKVNVPIFGGGWISPRCTCCYKNIINRKGKRLNIDSEIEQDKISDAMLAPTFKVTQFSKEGEVTFNVDCTDILKRMKVDISKLPTEEEVEKYYKEKENY